MKSLIKVIITGILFILIYSSCNNNKETGDNDIQLPYFINLDESMKRPESVLLSELGDRIRYIPLETKEECLLSRIAGIAFTDSFIYISDFDFLFQFNREGKFIKKIGNKGNGPGEYNNVYGFNVDEMKQIINIVDVWDVIKVYSLNGEFERSYDLDLNPSGFMRADSDHLVYIRHDMPQEYDSLQIRMFITDNDNNTIKTFKKQNIRDTKDGLSYSRSPFYKFDGQVHYKELGIDTLFYLNNLELLPYAVFRLSNKMDIDFELGSYSEYQQLRDELKNDPWIWDIYENKDRIFIQMNFGMSDSTGYGIYNKPENKVSFAENIGFLNDIDGGMNFWPRYIYKDNILVDWAEAYEMIDHITENPENESYNKENSRFYRVAEQLSYESNPVLMILSPE